MPGYARRRWFFFQAEDGIRDLTVTGVQTCALPISHRERRRRAVRGEGRGARPRGGRRREAAAGEREETAQGGGLTEHGHTERQRQGEIGRASCRERV